MQSMAEQPEFIRRQLEFAAHIRDPGNRPRPIDVEERRMAIYRELFYNNVESLLAGNFPVLRKLLADDRWHALIRDFFVRHRAQTPYFLEIAQEFLDYLQNERETEPRDPPFLLELAHYEWVELAVSISEESADPGGADPNGDLMTGIPLVSPLAWNLSYRFPVHRIGPGFQPDAPPDEPTHLVVYRARTDEVQFMEINAVTQRLLQLLQENTGWTGLDTVKRIAEELCHPQPELVVDAGRQLLYDLRARNIVLGTRRSAA
jgi:uncharacterized protein